MNPALLDDLRALALSGEGLEREERRCTGPLGISGGAMSAARPEGREGPGKSFLDDFSGG